MHVAQIKEHVLCVLCTSKWLFVELTDRDYLIYSCVPFINYTFLLFTKQTVKAKVKSYPKMNYQQRSVAQVNVYQIYMYFLQEYIFCNVSLTYTILLIAITDNGPEFTVTATT